MSFEYGGAVITARELSIEDDDNIARLINKLPDGAIVNSGTPFMEFMVGAEIKGDSPVSRIDADSTPEEVAAAYAAWRKLPRSFLKRWKQEVANADTLNPKA